MIKEDYLEPRFCRSVREHVEINDAGCMWVRYENNYKNKKFMYVKRMKCSKKSCLETYDINVYSLENNSNACPYCDYLIRGCRGHQWKNGYILISSTKNPLADISGLFGECGI